MTKNKRKKEEIAIRGCQESFLKHRLGVEELQWNDSVILQYTHMTAHCLPPAEKILSRNGLIEKFYFHQFTAVHWTGRYSR